MPDYFRQHGELDSGAEALKAALDTLLGAASHVPTEELPGFLGQLETIRITGMARLTAPTPVEPWDKLIGVGPAAERLGVSPDHLYHNSARFPFTRRVGRRLLFSSLGLDAYIKQQGSLTARRHGGKLPVVLQRKGEPA